MKIIVKNQISQILPLKDIGYTLLANDSVDLLTLKLPIFTIQNSKILMEYISTKTIIINNGERDLNPTEAIQYIFLNNYNKLPKNCFGNLKVDISPKLINTVTTYTSFGDDPDDPYDIGGGTPFETIHILDIDSTSNIKYIDFNTIDNLTYLFNGSLTVTNAIHDRVILELVSFKTNFNLSEIETQYKLIKDCLIVPSTTNIEGVNVDIPDIIDNTIYYNRGLVHSTLNSDGNRIPAYWNADWDQNINKFININPTPNGDGEYNMYSIEMIFIKMIDCLCSGTLIKHFQCYNVDRFATGTRLKLTTETRGPDHSWSVIGDIMLYRRYSI